MSTLNDPMATGYTIDIHAERTKIHFAARVREMRIYYRGRVPRKR